MSKFPEIFMTFVFVMFLLIAGTELARSHSFYDKDCCSGQDCAPVKSFVKLPNGNYVITLETGVSAILRSNYLEAEGKPGTLPMIKSSPDLKMHACIPSYWEPDMRRTYVRCIYIPGRI